MIKPEDLAKFGKVEICEEVNNTFHIRITDGFSDNATKTYECLTKVNKAIGHKYPMVKKCISEENYFDYIAKIKEDEDNQYITIILNNTIDK